LGALAAWALGAWPAPAATDIRFAFDGRSGPSVALLDASGKRLSALSPLVRWTGAGLPTSVEDRACFWIARLGPEGLTAKIARAKTGAYGEFVFTIELHNAGSHTVTGALLPPFTTWRDTNARVLGSSTEHLFLTSNRAEIGSLGVERAWSAGTEFDDDVFSTVPAAGGRYIASVLLLNAAGVKHDRDVITLESGQACTYELHLDTGAGGRNSALRETYRVRGGYRVHPSEYRFDHYNDPNLAWARRTVAVWLFWAWDKSDIDPRTGNYSLIDSLNRAKRLFGGFDAFAWWPFWPRAGFDARSQFDHYRDMPGGLDALREQVERAHGMGVKAVISYCHWSESDRDARPDAMQRSYADFAELACRVGADGALMDLMSKTPDEILALARRCGRELVPYNEGDPSWTDTQTNLLGRIHNDLPMPHFNLKKYLLPHQAQLRVCASGDAGRRMRNDFVLSFFNGHGVEINTMFPEYNPRIDEDWPILAHALDLLRHNRTAFSSTEWEPLIASADSAVRINRWPVRAKTLYTLCGTNPAGHHGLLLRVPHRNDVHHVDLWRYRLLHSQRVGTEDLISYDVDGYTPGLDASGSADFSPGCVGSFRERLHASLDFETLNIDVRDPADGETVEIWPGTVGPGGSPVKRPASTHAEVDLYKELGHETNEAIVVRLLDRDGEMEDVAVVPEDPIRFFRIDRPMRTAGVQSGERPAGMVRVRGGRFRYVLTDAQPPGEFPFAFPPFQPTYAYLPHQGRPVDRKVDLRPYWIDRYPVTNAEFARFVAASGYRPADATNFLKHFMDGKVPTGAESKPVVYVSYDDAKAYAGWAGKRLPTEEEWQYAAGASDGRSWPWGTEWDQGRANAGKEGPGDVDAHPAGASPFGVEDLVGNVWQLTQSLMDNGSHWLVMLRGGSWYRPPGGRWWVPGGPRKITENYPLPLAGPAMNRLATVGFRCVKDE
jgi:gamma-glutamyl hercynylcysteine S-oxide synthase